VSGSAAAAARRIEIAGMSALELGEPSAPVEMVFLHATGFHAALYAQLLAPLAAGRRIVAPDLRGHGRTRLPADAASLTSWDPFIEDVRRLLGELPQPVVIAGHSLGASVAVLAAAQDRGRIRALALFEPVIRRKPAADGPRHSKRTLAIAQSTANRRTRFESRQEAFEAYRGRGGFRTWPDEALRVYVEEGFTDAGGNEGGVTLRCAPAWEAAVYLAQGGDIFDAAQRATGSLLVRSGVDGTTFPPEAEQELLQLRPDADIAHVAGASHYLPIERPDLCRDAIAGLLAPGS
jgi:pimeloyl-ACP methyl ester carboxylesterase